MGRDNRQQQKQEQPMHIADVGIARRKDAPADPGEVSFQSKAADSQGIAERANRIKAAHLLSRAIMLLPERHPLMERMLSMFDALLTGECEPEFDLKRWLLFADVLAESPHYNEAVRDLRAAVEVLA